MGDSFGWSDSTIGFICIVIGGLLLALLVGWFVRRHIWMMVSLLGLVAGFFSGAVIFALIASASGWDDPIGLWIISIIMALVGLYLSYRHGYWLVLIATSFAGSYLFIRAWTIFYPGHWPTERQIIDGNVRTDDMFWIFFFSFILCFICSILI